MRSPEAGGPAASPSEGGVPLLRSDAESEGYRRQAELPSRLGRFVLIGLGGVIVGAGSGIWFAHPSAVADALLVLGALLIALGYVQHRLLLRDRDHWPKQAFLWEEGVELVLANGEIRAAPWSDPRFVLDLYARPVGRDAPDELLLAWKMDPKVPMTLITQEGFDRLRETAVVRGLEFSEYRADSRRRTLRGFEIRSSAPGPIPSPARSDTDRAVL
jgi:hypothetical protein